MEDRALWSWIASGPLGLGVIVLGWSWLGEAGVNVYLLAVAIALLAVGSGIIFRLQRHRMGFGPAIGRHFRQLGGGRHIPGRQRTFGTTIGPLRTGGVRVEDPGWCVDLEVVRTVNAFRVVADGSIDAAKVDLRGHEHSERAAWNYPRPHLRNVISCWFNTRAVLATGDRITVRVYSSERPDLRISAIRYIPTPPPEDP